MGVGGGGERGLIYSVWRFLWCKYSHAGQFQAANMVSRNTELERDKQMQYFHYTDKGDITSEAAMEVKR